MADKVTIEDELKIDLSQEDLERAFEHFSQGVKPKKIKHKRLPRAYFDTEALDLAAHKFSLRIQYKTGKKGRLGGYEQTVKCEAADSSGKVSSDKSLVRKECKNNLPDHMPDISAVSDVAARTKLETLCKKKALTHIFTASIERRYFEIVVGEGPDSGMVELAFDVGEFIVEEDKSHHQVIEIEVEAKAGSSQAIQEVKGQILKLAPNAKVELRSKSDRGTALVKAARAAARGGP